MIHFDYFLDKSLLEDDPGLVRVSQTFFCMLPGFVVVVEQLVANDPLSFQWVASSEVVVGLPGEKAVSRDSFTVDRYFVTSEARYLPVTERPYDKDFEPGYRREYHCITDGCAASIAVDMNGERELPGEWYTDIFTSNVVTYEDGVHQYWAVCPQHSRKGAR